MTLRTRFNKWRDHSLETLGLLFGGVFILVLMVPGIGLLYVLLYLFQRVFGFLPQ